MDRFIKVYFFHGLKKYLRIQPSENMIIFAKFVLELKAPIIFTPFTTGTNEGDNLLIFCKSQYQMGNILWYKNNILLCNSTSQNLTIINVQRGDGGVYKCRLFLAELQVYSQNLTIKIACKYMLIIFFD